MTEPRPTPEGTLTAIEVALDEVSRICKERWDGKEGWRTSIPTRADYDSDCIITDALLAARKELLAARVAPEGHLVWPTDPSYPCPTCGHRVAPEGGAPEGPWVYEKDSLLWRVGLPYNGVAYGRVYDFRSEAEALAVRDALNRLAAQAAQEDIANALQIVLGEDRDRREPPLAPGLRLWYHGAEIADVNRLLRSALRKLEGK